MLPALPRDSCRPPLLPALAATVALGVCCATASAADESENERPPATVYRLHEDQVLKWIPPAHAGDRPNGKRANNPQQLASEDIYEQEGANVRLRLQIFGGEQPLNSIVSSLLRASPCELSGDASVWMTPVAGDFIVRKNATGEQLVDELNRALQDDIQLDAHLQWEEVETDVWVIDGTFEPAPIGDAWRLPKDKNKSYVIYGRTGPGDVSRPISTSAGSFDDLLKAFGSRTGLPVVNEVAEPPSGFFGWQTSYDDPESTLWSDFPRQFARNVDLVADHFQEQTGLRIHKTRRKVRLLNASNESPR